MRKRSLLNSILFGLLLFCVWGVPAFGRDPSDTPVTMTALFVQAWLPELGELRVQTGSFDAGLIEVADLVLHGDFTTAEQKLDNLDQGASNNRARLLLLLWRRELEQRRCAYLSGGTEIFGAPMLDMMKRELGEKKRFSEIQSLMNVMPQADDADAQIANRYSLFLDNALYRGPAVLRSSKLGEETGQNFGDEGFIAQGLRAVEDAGRDAVQLHVLGETQDQLLAHLLKGSYAAARRDFGAARLQFNAGLERASQAGLQQCAAEFMVRLGDLEAIPFGDAMTFGYNVSSESQVRLMLKSNLMPSVRRVPSADALATSEVWYRKANTALDLVPQARSRHRLMIRSAHLARMRGDTLSAITLYREAAEQARQERAWTAAAVSDASAALLAGSRKLFLDSMKSLKDHGDIGAALSLAQMTHSWAARNWYVLQNIPLAISIFRMLGDALVDNHYSREAVDPLFDLASLCGATGRSEMSIEVIQEATDTQKRYIVEAETAEKEYQSKISNVTDEVGLSHELDLLGFLLFQLKGELDIKVITEGSQHWINQRDKVNRELVVLSGKSSSVVSNIRTQGVEHQNQINRIQAEVLTALQTKKCDEALLVFNESRARASQLNEPFLLVSLDALASSCDSQLVSKARAELVQINPLGELRKALASRTSPPTLSVQLALQRAVGNLFLLSNLSARIGAYDLLLKWVDDLDAMIQNDPTLLTLQPSAQAFRAVSLLGQNHPDQARDILNKLASDERLWSAADSTFKVETLGLLVEAESQLGNAEGSLFALERLRFEQDQWQQIRSGVSPALRMTAQQAMLEREVAVAGSVSPQQAERLRQMRDETAVALKSAQAAPSRQNIRDTISHIPAKTTLLVYHIGPQAITLWRATANEPLRMMRLKTSELETFHLITKLKFNLVNTLSWENESSELYKRLIPPEAMPTTNDDTIAVLANGILSSLPFEILGPSQTSLLMKNHAIVYLSRLYEASNQTQSPTTSRQRFLVAGLNSDGLTEAENEARIVGEILHADVVPGPEATSEIILNGLKAAKWVHLATHGHIDSTNPYSSYLVFAGGQRIEAWELFRYAPQAEMIVLSACDTKAGMQTLTGPAALTSDANSFATFAFAGGARWVLGSLWSADDSSSSTLMQEFYSSLVNKHFDPPHALQRAKLLVADGGKRQPYKYAQFVLSARSLSSLQ